MEKFTRVHPIIPLLIWAPIVTFLIARSFVVHGLGILPLAGVALSGLLVWTLLEYVLHRWVFHFVGQSSLAQNLQFMIHGLHHDDPNDATRLVMPPFPAVVLGVGFYMLFRAVLGPIWSDPFYAFFIIGYLAYDYTHFSVHHFRPRTRMGKMLKQNHMNHHFKAPDSLWGVSSPIWDYVFGTVEPKAKRPAHSHPEAAASTGERSGLRSGNLGASTPSAPLAAGFGTPPGHGP
jgi:sterol desaturase/sphingolipid hydroxylase (fatty acid hydroxylase superfamily)